MTQFERGHCFTTGITSKFVRTMKQNERKFTHPKERKHRALYKLKEARLLPEYRNRTSMPSQKQYSTKSNAAERGV